MKFRIVQRINGGFDIHYRYKFWFWVNTYNYFKRAFYKHSLTHDRHPFAYCYNTLPLAEKYLAEGIKLTRIKKKRKVIKTVDTNDEEDMFMENL